MEEKLGSDGSPLPLLSGAVERANGEVPKRFWVSWYGHAFIEFELHSPWWTSGYRGSDDAPTICAAIMAKDEEDAKMVVYKSHDTFRKGMLEFRFIEPKPDDWEPFSSRFQRADWMVWPSSPKSEGTEPATTAPQVTSEPKQKTREES